MKLVFKNNFLIISYILASSIVGWFDTSWAEIENSPIDSLGSYQTSGRSEAIGFLSIESLVPNTWSLLCPLTELLAQNTIKAVVLTGIENIPASLAWSYFLILQELRNAYNKPIVIYTDAVLKSAPHYAMCCGADAIVIAPWANVCGIEHSINTVFMHEKDKAEGKMLHYFYSGKYKNENAHLSTKPDTLKKMEKMLSLSFDYMVRDITARRPQVELYKDKWVQGTSLNAHEALTYGLIDGITDKIDLISYVFNLAGYPNRNVSNVDVAIKHPLKDSSFEHTISSGTSSIGIVRIHNLQISSWHYAQELLSLFKDETIEEIILDIRLNDEDHVIASNLHYDISKLKRIYKKPVIAYVEEALTAGYYIATAADTIIASPGAWIGSVGVSFSRWDITQQLKNQCMKYTFLAPQKFAHLFNEKVPLDPIGKDIIQKQLNFDHARFIQDIKTARPGLKALDDSQWVEGQAIIAQDALKLGLIDAIGTPIDALNYGKKNSNHKVHELSFIFKRLP